MEISPITNCGDQGKFGKSAVTVEFIAEGKKHKEARQTFNKLSNLFQNLNLQFTIKQDYLHHDQNHSVYLLTECGLKQFFIGIQDAGQINNQFGIIGGMCIGGSESIVGIDKNGKSHSLLESDVPESLNVQLEKIILNPKPTIYEIDTISRVSSFLGELTKNNQGKSKIFWHIPLPEYLFYIKQYYDSQIITKDQGLLIGEFLYKKSKVLSNWFSKNNTKNSIVESGSPLDKFVNLEEVFNLNLEQFLLKLSTSDSLWNLLIKNNSVASWTALGDLSYSYMYLSQNEKSEFILGIENPEEGKIFSQAKKQATNLNLPFNMTCLYLHPSYLEKEAFPSRLYRHKKTESIEALKVYKSYK